MPDQNLKTESGPMVKCPGCGTKTIYSSENKFRPFCSERCKLIDIGAWAGDEYRIASDNDDLSSDLQIEKSDAPYKH